MAVGSEVPQKGVLQASGYTPVKTELAPPIQLPGTGELWAKVGQTAMNAVAQAGEMLQKSPLNPTVKAQMLAQKKAAEEGVQQMEWADSLPEGYGHWIKSTDAQGNVTMIPAAQMTPTFQQKITPQEPSNREDEEKKKKGDPNAPGKKPKTTTTAPAAPTLAPEGEYSGYGASAGLPRATPNQPTVAPEPSDTKEREPGELLQPDTAGGATRAPYLSASTEPGPIPTTQPQSPEVERQSAADYRAQFAREHPTQGSMWTPGRPTPMAPPAPSQPPQQPSQQPSSAIQQVTDQPGVALANWQATTQTEPLTASDAMDWIKRQTTKAKHATYMPHGGPQGSPAYAFDMDGGGSNIIPVSQMVQNGAGPAVAAQNTSVVLSKSDQIKAQQQQAEQQQQDAQASQQQPQVAQGGQVWTPQQPSPTAPPAAPSDYDATQYRQAIAQAMARPNLMAQAAPQTGVRPTDAPPPHPPSASDVVTPVAPLSPEDQKAVEDMPEKGDADAVTGNPHVGKRGGYDWLRDPDYNNRQYTPLPGPDLMHENRWYLGDAGYRTVELKEGGLRHSLLMMSHTVPGINYTWGDIQKMEMPEVMMHLNEGKKFLSTKGDVVGPTQVRAAGQEEVIKQLEQVKDIVKTGDTSDYGNQAMESEKWNQDTQTLLSNKDQNLQGEWARTVGWWRQLYGGAKHPMAADMEQALEFMANGLKAPGMQPVSGLETPAEGGFSLQGYIPKFNIPIDIKKEGKPASSNPLDIPAIRYITQAGTREEKLRRIQQYEDSVIDFYKQTIREGMGDGQRFDLHHLHNIANLNNGKTLNVKDNRYRDGNGNLVNPYPEEVLSPAALKSQLRERGALPKSEPSQGLIAHSLTDVRKFMVNKPPGTHFHWTDSQGVTHEYMVP